MVKVMHPNQLNATFAALYNQRDLDGLLSLYESRAAHHTASTSSTDVGLPAIEASLRELLALGGHMVSRNNFCIVSDDLALLRADWTISDALGRHMMQGSSAEIARRQPDGSWRSVIDNAIGASIPRVSDEVADGTGARTVRC